MGYPHYLKKDPIKNEVDFSGAQGQITPKLMVWSGRNSNSFKLLGMSLLPARMKKIWSKMKALEWPQDNMLIFLALKGR